MKFDLNLILNIIAGIIVCIPLVIKLVSVTKEAVRNKNWNEVLSLIIELMKIAEASYTSGASKKEYVMNELKLQASKLNYTITDYDWQKISDAIDSMVALSKLINVK